MAFLEIKKFDDPILRKRCEEVKEINSEIEKLISDMIDTMIENRGVGLAAPQVGILKRIIVVQPDPKRSEVLVLINPRIIKKSAKKSILEEGCLSFPKLFFEISRPEEVEVEGYDINEDKINIKAEGFLSHVFQHEIDHLNGSLFFDRLGWIQRIKLKFKKPWR